MKVLSNTFFIITSLVAQNTSIYENIAQEISSQDYDRDKTQHRDGEYIKDNGVEDSKNLESNIKEDKVQNISKDAIKPQKLDIDFLDKELQRLNETRYEVFLLKRDAPHITFLPHVQDIELNKSAREYRANAQIYNNADEKSGFFIGVGLSSVDLFNTKSTNGANLAISNSLLISLRGGYQSFFNQYFGTRIYTSIFSNTLSVVYDYKVRSGEISPVSVNSKALRSLYLLGNLSADILLEFPLDYTFKTYIGGFLGLNIGAMYFENYQFINDKLVHVSYLWDHLAQVEYSLNIGLNITIDNSSRIETQVNAPFAHLQLPGFATPVNNQKVTFTRSYIFMVSYSYIF